MNPAELLREAAALRRIADTFDAMNEVLIAEVYRIRAARLERSAAFLSRSAA